jgi:hypothetical protein
MRNFGVAILVLTLPILAQAQAQAPANASSHTAESDSKAYRVFQDEPVANWRSLNDTVERIGGWKVYAREQLPVEKKASSQDEVPANPGARK